MELKFNLTEEEESLIREFQSIRSIPSEEVKPELHKILFSTIRSKVKVKEEANIDQLVKGRVLDFVQGKISFPAAEAPASYFTGDGKVGSVVFSKEYESYVVAKCIPIAVCQFACNNPQEYLLNSIKGTLRVVDPGYYEFEKVVARARKYRGYRLEYNDTVKSAEASMVELLHNLPSPLKSVDITTRVLAKSRHGEQLSDRLWIEGTTLCVSIVLENHLL